MESNKKILDEINKEEIFKEAKDIKLDPNAIFIEFNPAIASEKLLNLKKLSMQEKYFLLKNLLFFFLFLDYRMQDIWGSC